MQLKMVETSNVTNYEKNTHEMQSAYKRVILCE